MKITISGFRMYSDQVFMIADNEMTLISGRSGAGKSTILNAIYWCLYGSLRGIYSFLNTNGRKKGRVSVTLEFNDLIIYRQAGPGLFKVTTKIDNRVYQGDVAAKTVDHYFGEKSSWLSSSYIRQGELCLLLSGSNSDKMDLLNILSFNDEKPGEYIQVIDLELVSCGKKLKTLEQNYLIAHGIYSSKIKQRPYKSSLTMTQAELIEAQTQLTTKNNELSILNNKVNEQQLLKGKIATLKSSLSGFQLQLSSLSSFPQDRETQLKYEISQLEKQIKQNNQELFSLKESKKNQDRLLKIKDRYMMAKQKLETQQKILHTVEHNINSSYPSMNWKELVGKYNSHQISMFRTQQSQYLSNKKVAESYGILYSQESIEQRILNLKAQQQKISKYQNTLGIYNQYKTFIEQLKSIPIESHDQSEEDKLKQDLIQAKNAQDILTCPKCKASLRFHSGTLKLESQSPVSSNELVLINNKLKVLDDKKQRVKYRQQILNNISTLEKVLGGDQGIKDFNKLIEEVSSYNHQQIKTSISVLSKIKVMSQSEQDPDFLQILSNYREKQLVVENLQKNFDQLKNENPTIDLTTTNYDQNIIQLEEKISKAQQAIFSNNNEFSKINIVNNSRTMILKNIVNTESQLKSITISDEPLSQYQQVQKDINTLTHQIDNGKYANQMVIERDQLVKKSETFNIEQKKMKHLSKLKELAVKVECQQLQITVDSINAALSAILDSIFEEPITIQLRLFKQLKSSKRIKPQVNISVKYRGAEYNGVNDLSGGEASRASLAFVIALSSVSRSRVLLLDETMSTLDDELREKCLVSLKQLLGGSKTIVVINHMDNQGDYDRVITLG